MSSRVNPEEREQATLVAQLCAVQEDIDRARETARRAHVAFGLGRPVHHSAGTVARGEHMRLPDGAEIAIRPIERGDARESAAGFERLSSLSRFRRSRQPINHVTMSQLRGWTTLSTINNLPSGPIASRQLRRARCYPQSWMTCESTWASCPAGTDSKKSPATASQRLPNEASAGRARSITDGGRKRCPVVADSARGAPT